MLWRLRLPNPQATQHLGKVLGQFLSAGNVVLLCGELGAGKTTLVQGIGEGLGINEPIVSPTFTLINEYSEGRVPLYHLDLYRLSNLEIEELSPEIYWEGREIPPGIMAVEWAQRLPYKPPSYLEIQLVHTTENARQASLQILGEPENLSEKSLKTMIECWQQQESNTSWDC